MVIMDMDMDMDNTYSTCSKSLLLLPQITQFNDGSFFARLAGSLILSSVHLLNICILNFRNATE